MLTIRHLRGVTVLTSIDGLLSSADDVLAECTCSLHALCMHYDMQTLAANE
jgi:hypothetical protein